MKRRRFLKFAGVVGVFLSGVGAVVVKVLNGNDTEVLGEIVTAGPPILTAVPDTLTLAPGASETVTVTVDPASPFGVGSVTIPVTVATPLIGDVSGVYSDAHIVGDLNLIGDVFIEGLLTGIDTFHVQGNGFTVFFQNGGRADLHGKVKAPWGPWGTDTTGWVAGDRLAIASTKAGVYVPPNGIFISSEMVWTGDWAMTRPTDSPDVTLVDGTVAKPEVANLGQTIVFENLARGFHIHNSGGIQLLSDVKFVNCGTVGVLGNYPHHFHMVGENARGSLLERVVVEGGKNHAFVPHGSHGITYKDPVAFNTTLDPYWWDPPAGNPTVNNSDDILYDHPLALGVSKIAGTSNHRLSGFFLGAGLRNECRNGVAAMVALGNSTSGFQWPEQAHGVWGFPGNVAHNTTDGIFVWQNNSTLNLIDDFRAYNCKRAGVEHGAYNNNYQFIGLNLTNCMWGLEVHALPSSNPGGLLLFENVVSDSPLRISHHNRVSAHPVIYRTGTFPSVVVWELGDVGGYHRFEDCGLAATDFTFEAANSGSVIELWEAGVLTDRWAGGWA